MLQVAERMFGNLLKVANDYFAYSLDCGDHVHIEMC